ncbi:hypothetical protein [Candidatus Nitrospira allomarina]|uniref:Uncharacterized protein n=1 Tax=Candidatus Nitrospira allomarina TaxID=3020900 RepID=A0AA96GH31_9BACT|nr:hypothetical protein [Candidatus Nitrospira allomarina]WNM60035.1 hypothetical protein PP769_09845 [Candidatus Nitrospira allomarina]
MGDDANSAFISFTNPCLLCALAGGDEFVAGCVGATEMRAPFLPPTRPDRHDPLQARGIARNTLHTPSLIACHGHIFFRVPKGSR